MEDIIKQDPMNTTTPSEGVNVNQDGGDDAAKKDGANFGGKQNGKRPWKHFQKQRRVCYFCASGIYQIDYKDCELLNKYINSYCKIMPRRQTRCCNKHQGYLANAIKRARIVGLLPFIKVE